MPGRLVEPQHRHVRDHLRRPAAGQAEPLAPTGAVAVAGRRDEVDAVDEHAALVREDHERPLREDRVIGLGDRPGEPHGRACVPAYAHAVEVAEAVDLRSRDEAAGHQPAPEHIEAPLHRHPGGAPPTQKVGVAERLGHRVHVGVEQGSVLEAEIGAALGREPRRDGRDPDREDERPVAGTEPDEAVLLLAELPRQRRCHDLVGRHARHSTPPRFATASSRSSPTSSRKPAWSEASTTQRSTNAANPSRSADAS